MGGTYKYRLYSIFRLASLWPFTSEPQPQEPRAAGWPPLRPRHLGLCVVQGRLALRQAGRHPVLLRRLPQGRCAQPAQSAASTMTGAELAEIRKAAGLSQTMLARRAGIGRHAVSYWEQKAQVDLRAWAIRRMAGVLTLPDYFTPVRAHAGWADRLRAEEMAREAAICARIVKWEAARAERAAKRQVRCRAKTRKGTPCRALSLPGKRRCKFHGGMSTGARTPEGIERIREAQRRRWARWRANAG